MPNINLEIGEVLEKIKLGNSFLLLGALIILTSIIVNNNIGLQNNIGLKLGLIIFLSGCFFRLANIVLNKTNIKNSFFRFIIWMILLGISIYFITKLVPIS